MSCFFIFGSSNLRKGEQHEKSAINQAQPAALIWCILLSIGTAESVGETKANETDHTAYQATIAKDTSPLFYEMAMCLYMNMYLASMWFSKIISAISSLHSRLVPEW